MKLLSLRHKPVCDLQQCDTLVIVACTNQCSSLRIVGFFISKYSAAIIFRKKPFQQYVVCNWKMNISSRNNIFAVSFLGLDQRAPQLLVCMLIFSVGDNSTVFQDIQFVECHGATWRISCVLYSDQWFWIICFDGTNYVWRI